MKILGICALTGCDKRYYKILQLGKIYHFHADYFINPETDEISFNDPPPNLYKIKELAISVSAIVGKNGSGKSTIIELLLMIINNMSYKKTHIKGDLFYIPGLHACLYFQTDSFYKVVVDGDSVKVFRYEEGKPRRLKFIDFEFENFFYTVGINYSQYALNSKEIGNWVNGLFHKNDGYQIPAVINPMRSAGNFDINKENELVKARLISNLARPIIAGKLDFRNLTDRAKAIGLRLSPNHSNRLNKELYTISADPNKTGNSGKHDEKISVANLQINHREILNEIDSLYGINLDFYSNTLDDKRGIGPAVWYRLALEYVIYKISSIAITYPAYQKFFVREKRSFVPGMLKIYLKLLLDDTSHVVYKLKQTLNFLKYQHIEPKLQYLPLNKLSKAIDRVIDNSNNNLTEENRIELLPPPIFTPEIVLNERSKEQRRKTRRIEFHTLSSGEKQLIYSTSSVIYHLLNLDSVSTGIRYKNINIVLDEIELYFHPEMQRKYLRHLLDNIENQHFKHLQAINLCFITHSPFILSDLPHTNVMFLQINDEENNEVEGYFTQQIEASSNTFCANIHDLLASSFFLDQGFMGEFATRTIQKLVSDIVGLQSNSNMQERKLSDERIDEINYIISIVGEPLLKQKLKDLVSNATIFESIEDRITRLKRELNEALIEKGHS